MKDGRSRKRVGKLLDLLPANEHNGVDGRWRRRSTESRKVIVATCGSEWEQWF